MACADRFDIAGFGGGDVEQSLAGYRGMAEGDEIGRMPGAQAFADFGVLLEAADAGAMTAARIDDDDRLTRGIAWLVSRWKDAQQGIVDRMRQVVAVDQHLVGKLEQQGIAGALVGQGIVATLAQCIPEQQAALPAVDQVFPAVSRAGGTQATFVEEREQGRMALAEGIEHKLAVQLLQTAEVFEQIME